MVTEISVVITTYNQPYESIKASILSVLKQQDVAFELIISDDCSEAAGYFPKYRDLFLSFGFMNYQLIENSANVKTVKNIIGALRQARGEYVKVIDAGDLLYSEHTLRSILDFCRQHDVFVGYGDLIRFECGGHSDEVLAASFLAPRAPKNIDSPLTMTSMKAFRLHMDSADWIPAPAQFYKTSYYLNLLIRLSDEYGVEYCQDFTASLALLEQPIFHLCEPIYWYEWGTGISTNGGLASRKRLYDDHLKFYRALKDRLPDAGLSIAYIKYRIRRFVALHTPLYDFLLRRARNVGTTNPVEITDFFRCCFSTEREG